MAQISITDSQIPPTASYSTSFGGPISPNAPVPLAESQSLPPLAAHGHTSQLPVELIASIPCVESQSPHPEPLSELPTELATEVLPARRPLLIQSTETTQEFPVPRVSAQATKSIVRSYKSLLESFSHDDAVFKSGFSTLVLPAEGVTLEIITTSLEEIPLSRFAASALSDDTSPKHPVKNVLAIRQTRHDVKAVVNVCQKGSQLRQSFTIYYNPYVDSQIVFSDHQILTMQLLKHNTGGVFSTQTQSLGSNGVLMEPGIWRIFDNEAHVADFWILEKSDSVKPSPTSQQEVKEPQPQDKENDEAEAEGKGEGDEEGKAEQEEAQSLSLKHKLSSQSDDEADCDRNKKQRKLIEDMATAATEEQAQSQQHHLAMRGRNPLFDMKLDTCVAVDANHDDGYTLERDGKIIHNTTNSRVYGAKLSGKPIMVKVLNSAVQSDHEYNKKIRILAESYIREFSIQRRLKHDSIVSLVGGDARFFALFMQPVKAHDLSDLLKWRYNDTHNFRGQYEDAINILREGASALKFMHSQNIAHNDIKPGNLLYSRRTGLKICDFGIASPDKNASFHVTGTPWYVPPEAMKSKDRGFPGDIWAFGVTMLYVVGRIPLPETTTSSFPPWRIQDLLDKKAVASKEKMEKWINHVWDIVASLGPLRVNRSIRFMTRRDPDERVTAEQLADEWDAK